MENEKTEYNYGPKTATEWVFAVILLGAIFYASVRFAIP
jgi:hypothetical protein